MTKHDSKTTCIKWFTLRFLFFFLINILEQNLVLLLSLSLHSSSLTFKLLSMASYGGELLLDSSSPWSGISSHLSSFFIPLPFIFKKQRTSSMKKIQGPQAPYGATSCGIRASSSRWCSFASSIFLFGQLTLIPCSSSYSPCISSIFLWFGVV